MIVGYVTFSLLFSSSSPSLSLYSLRFFLSPFLLLSFGRRKKKIFWNGKNSVTTFYCLFLHLLQCLHLLEGAHKTSLTWNFLSPLFLHSIFDTFYLSSYLSSTLSLILSRFKFVSESVTFRMIQEIKSSPLFKSFFPLFQFLSLSAPLSFSSSFSLFHSLTSTFFLTFATSLLILPPSVSLILSHTEKKKIIKSFFLLLRKASFQLCQRKFRHTFDFFGKIFQLTRKNTFFSLLLNFSLFHFFSFFSHSEIVPSIHRLVFLSFSRKVADREDEKFLRLKKIWKEKRERKRGKEREIRRKGKNLGSHIVPGSGYG